MGKTLNLKIAGVWSSPNDYTTKEGALDNALNCVVDQKDLGQSRRGFENFIDNSSAGLDGYLCRSITAVDQDALPNSLLTYRLNNSVPEGRLLIDDTDTITGENRFLPPGIAKTCRFLNWGKYVYVSSDLGVLRYDSVDNSCKPAGVPQALDLELSLSGSSGFFVPNEAKSITADITNASPTLSKISDDDIAGLLVGQVLQGTGIPVGTLIDSITLSQTSVIYSTTLTAGASTFSVTSNSGISVGYLVSGTGIQTDTRVTNISGVGPYTITVSKTALISGSQNVTFSTDNTITMSANATGTTAAASVSVSDGSQVAYRLIWGFKDQNQQFQVGAPSGFATITNNLGESRDVQVVSAIPEGITTDYFYQLYRSPQTSTLDITPVDQMQLVVEAQPDSTDISNGYVTILDQTPDSLKGEALYTGTDVEGIAKQNDQPPISVDIASYRGFGLFGNITFPHQLKLIIDGVGGSAGIQLDDEITIDDGTSTFTVIAKASENIASGHFEIFTSGTPAQNIADTANSFIRVINRYASNSTVYAYLLSGPSDLPGQILIKARSGIGEFTVEASANGDAWTPNISTAQSSEAENLKNRILVSKPQQFGAAPASQLVPVGDIDNVVLRIVALRDYAIVLTSNGAFRLTGQTFSDMVAEPFDTTITLAAPESAVALGNECYCLATVGVVSISDGGVRLRSALQIQETIQTILRVAPQSVEDVAFGVGYEGDQRYILALPDSEGDTYPVLQWTYNYIQDSWCPWDRQCSAGYVNKKAGLYLANGNNTNIVLERKNGNFTDYIDESRDITITAVSGFEVTVDDTTGVEVGDILWQSDAGIAIYSEILEIDASLNVLTVSDELSWQTSGADSTKVFTAIENVIQWKPNDAGDPTEAKQFSEGQVVFKRMKFSHADLDFATDVSPSFSSVEVPGQSGSGWGLFAWGNAPWGGGLKPKTIRFYIPGDKQYGGILILKMTIRSGYSNWQLEGASVFINDISEELGSHNA